MITPFNGRDPYNATRVAVYRNLHVKAWSVMALDGKHQGQVVAHADALALDIPVFKVNEQGRQRVIAEHRKNVHAMVAGRIRAVSTVPVDVEMRWVTYNPYKFGHFYMPDLDGAQMPAAVFAVFDENGKVFVG